MSTASVADGLYSSTYSASPSGVGSYWISLMTMFGFADCDGGISAALVCAAIWLRRSWMALTSLVRAEVNVGPPHFALSSATSAPQHVVHVSNWVSRPLPVRNSSDRVRR